MLEKWDISLERVHLVITDNASNMKKAMLDASLQHFGCFAHSLQLVIQDGLLSQRAVIDIIAICKSIVDIFTIHLLPPIIQESLNVPQHKLIQNISTL